MMNIKDEMPKEGNKVTWEDDGCFVCGRANTIGLKLDFEVDKEKNTSKSEVVFTREYQGWDKVVHGGILAAVLDDAMAYALMSLENLAITTRMTVTYRKPVMIGEKLYLEGSVVKLKSRLATTRAAGYTIENDEKVIKVEAEGTFYLDHPTKRG